MAGEGMSMRRRPPNLEESPDRYRLAEEPLIYRAAVAMPQDDRVVATDQLRRQLRIMAAAAGATLDWTTLAVTGPMEIPGAEAATRFEWTASVAFRGGANLHDLPDPGWLPSLSRRLRLTWARAP
jgi:hypothetical protein